MVAAMAIGVTLGAFAAAAHHNPETNALIEKHLNALDYGVSRLISTRKHG